METLISTTSTLVKGENITTGKVATNFVSNLVTNTAFNSITSLFSATGAGEYVDDDIPTSSNVRPKPKQSEIDHATKVDSTLIQKSFHDKKTAKYGEKDSVRIDTVKDNFYFEVKNYNLSNENNVSSLINTVVKQLNKRSNQLPDNAKQVIVFDIRGQDISYGKISEITQKIFNKTIVKDVTFDLLK